MNACSSFLFFGYCPFSDCLQLLGICLHHAPSHAEAQVRYLLLLKEALGSLEVEVVLSQLGEHPMHQPAVLLEVLGEDENSSR